MDANLTKHKATPATEQNHFSRADLAARARRVDFWAANGPVARRERAERILAAMVAHAKWSGRGMARLAVTYLRKDKAWLRHQDIGELFTTPHSTWVAQQWVKLQVAPSLVGLAEAEMRRYLRIGGWRV